MRGGIGKIPTDGVAIPRMARNGYDFVLHPWYCHAIRGPLPSSFPNFYFPFSRCPANLIVWRILWVVRPAGWDSLRRGPFGKKAGKSNRHASPPLSNLDPLELCGHGHGGPCPRCPFSRAQMDFERRNPTDLPGHARPCGNLAGGWARLCSDFRNGCRRSDADWSCRCWSLSGRRRLDAWGIGGGGIGTFRVSANCGCVATSGDHHLVVHLTWGNRRRRHSIVGWGESRRQSSLKCDGDGLAAYG